MLVDFIKTKGPTLGDILSSSLFTSKRQQERWLHTTIIFTCKSLKCASCTLLGDPCAFLSYSTGEKFETNQPDNCQSKYLIYVISCTECLKQYVGRTRRRLCDRLRDHMSNIRMNENSNTARYLNQHHGSFIDA